MYSWIIYITICTTSIQAYNYIKNMDVTVKAQKMYKHKNKSRNLLFTK